MRDDPERLRQRPRRERIGRESTVHQGDCRAEALIGQIWVERRELRGGEHALVDQSP